jgi:hypothetical protein
MKETWLLGNAEQTLFLLFELFWGKDRSSPVSADVVEMILKSYKSATRDDERRLAGFQLRALLRMVMSKGWNPHHSNIYNRLLESRRSASWVDMNRTQRSEIDGMIEDVRIATELEYTMYQQTIAHYLRLHHCEEPILLRVLAFL